MIKKNLLNLPKSERITDIKKSIFSILILLFFSSACVVQKQKLLLSGVVSDEINGMRIDSVKVSTEKFTTRSKSDGSFKLDVTGNQKDYPLSFSKDNFNAINVGANATSNIIAKMKSPYPLRNILHLFTNSNIPERGPNESPTTPKCADTTFVPKLVGGQLNKHDFIYIGENHRRICVVIGGKLAWHYDTENHWEDDEVWMLSNGNILHAHMKYIEIITPMKEVLWRYDNPVGSEIHTCQPIGFDKVLFVQNQGEASIVKIYNIVTKEFELEKELKELSGKRHTQCRRIRKTSQGNYFTTSTNNQSVYEYDKDFNLVSSKKIGPLWGGVKLKNGNFLFQSEGAKTSKEIDKAGNIVWQVSIEDIQSQLDELAPSLAMVKATQNCERLSNGNTVVFTRYCNNRLPQAIEIRPDKKVVWILQDWQHLGDSVSAQFLDEPGYPEVPSDTNH